MPSFYADNDFINVVYATDLAIENHFKNLLLNDTSDRIVYASNAYALRKRSDNNSGTLDLPFINYHLENYEPGPRRWWHPTAYTTGVYIPEIEAKVRYAPITLTYEATYWSNRNDELLYAVTEANFDADNKTVINPTIEIESTDISLTAVLQYSGNSYDPTYNEQDWLEQNKIHSASLDFTLDTFAIKSNTNITIPLIALLEFSSYHGEETTDEVSYEEEFQFLIDHVNEEVTES